MHDGSRWARRSRWRSRSSAACRSVRAAARSWPTQRAPARSRSGTTAQRRCRQIRQAIKPLFEAQWAPGTTVTQVFNGSGNGINDLTAAPPT